MQALINICHYIYKNLPLALLLSVMTMTVSTASHAQEARELNGVVMILDTSTPLSGVNIKNLNTGTEIQSNDDGRFSIPIELNQRLEFRYAGFRVDTVVIIEFDFKRVYMTPADGNIRIEEVEIRNMSDARLVAEIQKAKEEGRVTDYSQQRGGLRISPSRWFGNSGRKARERHNLLLAEQDRRQIDLRFSVAAIQQLTPLKGRDLELYMTKYRPTVAFVTNSSEEEMRLYIMDSFAEYNKLTEAQKNEIALPTDSASGN